jgi:hypothetical protein
VILIKYQSHDFPTLGSGILQASWDELLWAALTIGRPSTYHVFRYGPASFHEAIFRLAVMRLAIEQDSTGHLHRTDAFSALDPTEKGMVGYFLGMVLCKLFASRLLSTPWLLHLDVFRATLNPLIIGRSRPDLVGEDDSGNWHAFESKGRSSVPSSTDMEKAKSQAQRLISVNAQNCILHVGSFAFFRNDLLEFYWRDPEPDEKEPIELPNPEIGWRFYYEPAFSLASDPVPGPLASERSLADVVVSVHPEISELLDAKRWSQAKRVAMTLRDVFKSQGYQPDGLRVTAGASWKKAFEPRASR